MNDFEQLLRDGLGFVWLLILAIWGGTVNYINHRKGKTFSLAELVGEWCISGFVGVATIYLCLEWHVSWYLMGFLVAIAGHMGGRGLFLYENMLKRKFGVKEDEPPIQ